VARILNKRITWRVTAPIVVDGALILLAVLVSTALLTGPRLRAQPGFSWFVAKVGLLAIICRLCLCYVAPRPERPEFVEGLTEQIPFYGQRHAAKPGLPGWAQVRYTCGASVEDAMEKPQYDLFCTKNMSAMLDLFIVFSTIKTVLRSEGSR